MKYFTLIVLAVLSFSCDTAKQGPGPLPTTNPPAVETREAPRTYTCMGNEPFWSVQIKGREITFRTPDEGPVTYPYQAPQERNGQKIFTGKAGSSEIKVVIREASCTDTMSGEKFPYTVEVDRDGKMYSGCGK